MSYSFTITAPNKTDAKAATAAKFDEIVAAQPAHAHDRTQALAAADAFIDMLAEDSTQNVRVAMNGYVSGLWTGTDVTTIQHVAVTVGASLVARA